MVYGPEQAGGSLDQVFTGVMSKPYFPIRPDQLRGQVSFQSVGPDDFAVNGAKVRSRWIRHTDPTLGFRVEVEGVSVAYLPDHSLDRVGDLRCPVGIGQRIGRHAARLREVRRAPCTFVVGGPADDGLMTTGELP